ncbi:MAG: MoxR-like ATPase [Clostridiales bacterium]|nr:MoxR-like ATPase [Clostridiales bacterium]MDK2903350.1 MoxR-like ATPase [Clostridiales bacterium]MDK2992119.1 MoxR-like ATPase [Clostridiales bacterium]
MDLHQSAKVLKDNIEKALIGKSDAVELVLVALLCRGHALIEDVPGVGKTTLVKALARSIQSSFSRIQFTTDLLPSDIIGVSIYNQKDQRFEFKKGPIFSNIILADEINRASPKTQSSLLEVMGERQITVDGVTYNVSEPFMVLATQNPIEYEGTFPLPEAQLDRFTVRINMGYPQPVHEKAILQSYKNDNIVDHLEPVLHGDDVIQMQEAVSQVYVDDSLYNYIVNIANRTRNSKDIYLGASPRASLVLLKASQALAFIRGREYVLPDDIKNVAVPVLAHRIIVRPEYRLQNKTAEDAVRDVLANLNVPAVRNYA